MIPCDMPFTPPKPPINAVTWRVQDRYGVIFWSGKV